MSRVAFVMDRIFRRFGLSGKSFIPMLIATGCGIPGVMASRTIENERDRRITIMVTTFMPCSAKLPIIALVAGSFPNNSLIAPSAYFVGIFTIVISGIMLKKTKLLGGSVTPFIMELPNYHMPKWSNVLRYALDKGLSFIKRAGTIILAMTIVLWFLTTFNFRLQVVDMEQSILAGDWPSDYADFCPTRLDLLAGNCFDVYWFTCKRNTRLDHGCVVSCERWCGFEYCHAE